MKMLCLGRRAGRGVSLHKVTIMEMATKCISYVVCHVVCIPGKQVYRKIQRVLDSCKLSAQSLDY